MNNYGYGRFNGPAKHVAPRPKGKIRLFFELWWANVWSLIPLNAVYSVMTLLLIPSGFAAAGIFLLLCGIIPSMRYELERRFFF